CTRDFSNWDYNRFDVW
nr:immunoglobulin heavy chain junction region [Macaca mulatta]MOW24439.1 immunoglobulin heavy chain junction region [Macaca mulatta]MOW24498.1 immunoglobulin heavy chain junction region [Macaca mulatta]MOW24502.1 immunoglobulin heavy chain junction region [Macaca mulatta]MOW24506.1 immunoglobulin heavy chain junction region [Macaca mulatta]